jgi:vesicular inhibitory amino acid transporter
MTSIPVVSSAMTAPSVRDVIASCVSSVAIFTLTGINILLDRRAQYFLASSTLPSPFVDEDAYLQDEEADVGSLGEQDEEYYFESTDTRDHTTPQNDFVNQLEWDEDLEASNPTTTRPEDPLVSTSVPVMGQIAKRMNERRKRAARPQPVIPSSLNPQWNIPHPQETTPLLVHKGSVSFDVPPRRLSMSAKTNQLDINSPQFAAHERRVSNVSLARSTKSNRSVKIMGQSTFGQTVRSLQVQWSGISNSIGIFSSSSIP